MAHPLFQGPTWWVLLSYYALGTPILYVLFRRTASSLKPVALQASMHALSIPVLVVVANNGASLWFPEDMWDVSGSSGRLFGHSRSSQWLIVVIAWYLVIEIVLKVVCQSFEKTKPSEYFVQYCHHVITVGLAIHILTYGFIEYYAAYFVGVAEMSPVPLQFMNFFKMFKVLGSAFPTTISICRAAFALSFLFFRGFWWPKVCVSFWADLGTLLSSEDSADLHGIPVRHPYMWLAVNAGFTGLQWFWTSKVVYGVRQAFRNAKAS